MDCKIWNGIWILVCLHIGTLAPEFVMELAGDANDRVKVVVNFYEQERNKKIWLDGKWKTVIKDVKAKILNNISGNGQDQEVTINWDNGKGSTTFSSAFVNYMLDSTIEKGRTMGYPYIVSVKITGLEI